MPVVKSTCAGLRPLCMHQCEYARSMGSLNESTSFILESYARIRSIVPGQKT